MFGRPGRHSLIWSSMRACSVGVHLLRFVLHVPCCGCETEGGWCQSGGKARARHRRCELADLMATVSFACRREESVEGRLWRFARRKSSRTICGGGGGGVFCHYLYDGVGSEDLSEPDVSGPLLRLAPVRGVPWLPRAVRRRWHCSEDLVIELDVDQRLRRFAARRNIPPEVRRG